MLPLGVGTSEAELSCEVVFLFKARVKGSWIQAGAGFSVWSEALGILGLGSVSSLAWWSSAAGGQAGPRRFPPEQ